MTRKSGLTLVLALAFGVLLGYLDVNSKEVQLPMFCLLLFSFTLGALQPTGAWRWGILIGLSVPVAHYIGLAVNYRAIEPLRYPFTLAVLVIPALIASYAGAFAGRRSQSPIPAPRRSSEVQ